VPNRFVSTIVKHPVHCNRWRSSTTLRWYLRVTESGARRLMHGLVKPSQFCVSFIALWSWNGIFQTLQAVSFKSVFVPILTYGYESWVMTEIILSQVKAAEMRFLRRLCVVTLRDKLRSCEMRRALNVEPLLRIQRSQLLWFGHVSRITHERLARQVLLAKPRESGPEVVQGPSGVTTSLTFLGPVLVCSQQNYLILLLTWYCC